MGCLGTHTAVYQSLILILSLHSKEKKVVIYIYIFFFYKRTSFFYSDFTQCFIPCGFSSHGSQATHRDTLEHKVTTTLSFWQESGAKRIPTKALRVPVPFLPIHLPLIHTKTHTHTHTLWCVCVLLCNYVVCAGAGVGCNYFVYKLVGNDNWEWKPHHRAPLLWALIAEHG